VARVRRLLGTRKVGHAGTLDPMATGVLIIGVEKATRLLGYLSLVDKAYEATIRLGMATVTDDAEGEVVSAAGAADVLNVDLEAAIANLRGEILQVPSSVSAIKISGERSYARVRGGRDVELAARPVRVSRFCVHASRLDEVAGVAVLDVDVQVECSTGTYVRALDEAEKSLRLMPLDHGVRRCFATLIATDTQASYVGNGRRLTGVTLPEPTTALLSEAGQFLALYRQEGHDAVALAVFV
jgi:tRNA pseudouridine55 synthase